VLSQVADKVFYILLIVLLDKYYATAGMENSMRSTLMLAFTLPAILFGAVGGIFVDRFGKKASADGLESGSRLTDVSYPGCQVSDFIGIT